VELLQPELFVVPCTADFDHAGSVNFLDVKASQEADLSPSLQADLDEDGLVDLQDAADFIDAYNNGC
jgi:hypothetical protein